MTRMDAVLGAVCFNQWYRRRRPAAVRQRRALGMVMSSVLASTFHIFHAVLSSGAKRDDFRFTQTGDRETGFPLFVARTNRSYFRDQDGPMRSHESSDRSEVIEFSEALGPARKRIASRISSRA